MLGEPLIVTLTFVRSGKMNFFRIPCALAIRFYEQDEDGFHGPSLSVDFDVQPRVSVFHERGPLYKEPRLVIDRLFATGVNAVRLVCQCLAADCFVL